jgi:hypothetical protein
VSPDDRARDVPPMGEPHAGARHLAGREEILRGVGAARGRIVERGQALLKVNDRPVARVTWAFELEGDLYEGTLLHRDEKVLNESLPEDEVAVLYDPADPRVNTLWVK